MMYLDRTQVLQHLQLLGYGQGDQVHFRLFYPRKEDNTSGGRKITGTFPNLPWHSLEKLQQKGMGLYVVVNGGGHSDEQITHGRAIFYEHDDLPKAQQVDLFKTLNLPLPTFQVDTGSRSIHSYWVFEQPIPIEEWRKLQKDLLAYSKADSSIKNPSRVMRLA